MKHPIRNLLVLIAIFCSVSINGPWCMGQPEPGKLSTRQIDFASLQDAKRNNRSVPMKVHLPGGKGPYPVVVVSHGAGGNLDSNFAQAKHLATHGYIAICVEHIGSNTKKALSGGLRVGKTIAAMTRDADEVMNRPQDIRFAIDQVEKWNRVHTQLKGKFDLRRIGVMGHSFGAYTTLVICGARPALDWFQPKIGTGKGLGPNLFDKRVRCGVALSPQGPGEPFFLSTSYSSIRVPLLGISGTKDKQQSAEPIHRKNSFQHWPKGDRFLLWINNANHLQFSDATGSKRQTRIAAMLGKGREDVQKVSRAATLVFFNQYLKKSPGVVLREKDLRRHMGGIVDGIELLSK